MANIMNTYVFDFIVSNIIFNNPAEYKLSEIIVNISFLEAKLELYTTNDGEFREGRSFEFKSTQEDLKDSLSISSIKVYVQKTDTDNRRITLDSYLIDWNYRLFEKLETQRFTDYSQLEHQNIIYNDNLIGSIIMGFQINIKEEHSKYETGSDEIVEKSSRRKLTKHDNHTIGDSLVNRSQHSDISRDSDKYSDPNDVLFFIDEETRNSATNMKNLQKILSRIPYDGPNNLRKLNKYAKNQLKSNESISSNICDVYPPAQSNYSNKIQEYKNDYDINSGDNQLTKQKSSRSNNSCRFKIRKSRSSLNFGRNSRNVAGGKMCCSDLSIQNDDCLKNFNLNDFDLSSTNLKNDVKCFQDHQSQPKPIGKSGQNHNTYSKCPAESSTKHLLKCKSSAVNKILDEYNTSEMGGGATTPHLSQILAALKSKYGEEIANTSKISTSKCLPEGLETKLKNSKIDPACFSKKKRNGNRKTAKYKTVAPACLTRKSVNTHDNCQRKDIGVPKRMGWLWNINKEMVSRGWKPGAISLKIKNLMNHFLKDFPADTLPVFKPDKKFHTNKEILTQKPTLKLKKCGGEYIIVMRPLKTAEDIACSADPYLDMKPIKFKIKKNYESCDDETDDEFDVEFTPPAGLIKPNLLNRPIKACKETQYIENDYNFKPVYERVKQKFDKIPGFCKDYVKEYNMANRPLCKMPSKQKKKGGKKGEKGKK